MVLPNKLKTEVASYLPSTREVASYFPSTTRWRRLSL
jgi:hypothetical protein